jgi:hypothetical protein
MTPAAAAYFRKRPWLTPEVCRQWKMGYLPRDGRSLFRGSIVYAHTDETGEILTYSARDPLFDEKWAAWIRDGRPEKSKPMKHRYVKGYHRGLELFGQSAERLQDRRLKESLGSLWSPDRHSTIGWRRLGRSERRAAGIRFFRRFAARDLFGRRENVDAVGVLGIRRHLGDHALDRRCRFAREFLSFAQSQMLFHPAEEGSGRRPD